VYDLAVEIIETFFSIEDIDLGDEGGEGMNLEF